MLQNPAMEEYLVELEVVPGDFKFPSQRTVTKRLDDFLDEEGASQDSHVREILPLFSGAWDELSSKQRLNYMAVNVVGIMPDFKLFVDHLVGVSLFPYPHDMPAICLKVLEIMQPLLLTSGEAVTEEVVTESGPLLAGFLQKFSSLTYDGAAANYAFSPDPVVSGINADESSARRAVCARYKGVEERRCFCHRAILVMEHSYDDSASANDASKLMSGLIKKIYCFMDMINGSQKNEQELRRVQEADSSRATKRKTFKSYR
jgi:hypothetical protein